LPAPKDHDRSAELSHGKLTLGIAIAVGYIAGFLQKKNKFYGFKVHRKYCVGSSPAIFLLRFVYASVGPTNIQCRRLNSPGLPSLVLIIMVKAIVPPTR
jgi:hypothetical protein